MGFETLVVRTRSCLPTGNGFKNTKKPSAILLKVPGTRFAKLSLGTVRLKNLVWVLYWFRSCNFDPSILALITPYSLPAIVQLRKP